MRLKNIMAVTLLFLSIGIISANTLSLESNNDGTWNVNFSSDTDIGGFQFNVDDATVNSASGGEAGANGFMVSTAGSLVLGFSLTGATIPAGSGTLIELSVTGTPSGLSNIIMSDADGNQIDFTYLPSEGDEPAEFAFNQSPLQAGYFFAEVTLNGNAIESDDWVGVFNGDICVGARQWDISECGGGVCDVIAMGNDGQEYSIGYCNTGDIPSFKIYDTSENIYYDATPTEEFAWSNNGFNLIDGLSNEASIAGCTNPDACNYNSNATEDDGSCIFAENNYDCYGNCVVEIDCSGECGGSAELDECGICDGDGIPEGECDCNNNVEDCAGVCGGDAALDDCGVCNGGNADDLGCGCFEAGPSGCDNECGSTSENDCAGECGGNAELDSCGVCEGEDADDLGCGCFNPAPETYYMDNDGDGLGSGEGQDFCSDPGAGWVDNNLDDDDTCSGIVDDCGICNGNNENDLGCGCFEPAPSGCDNECGSSLENDDCGVCGGDNSSCADCTGVPNGESAEDNCGTCDDDPNNDCTQDCNGDWGGAAEVDECGICNGNGANAECWDGEFVCNLSECSDMPSDSPFTYNQSTLQAFYYFETVAINGITVESEDWVGAFNGDICVGARKWDTSLCGNGICDVPVMGDDGTEVTVGYMNTGEYPSFKIYDASENTYYNAVPANDEAWANFALYIIPSLNGGVLGCTDSNACNFDADATIDNGSCTFAEVNFDCNGDCIVEIDCTGECGGGAIIDECGICGGTGIPDGECDCEGNVEDCAGVCDGSAETDACGDCNGDGPPVGYTCEGTPELLAYNQSTLQAFYYFNFVTLNGISLESDDWVGAFNGEICVGSRKWDTSLCNSGVCDVPLMGSDDNEWTDGYMQPGNIPTFRVFDASSNEYFEALPSENIEWNINDIYVLDALQGGILGCTDNASCNFDSDANVDDGSCILPDENYDCDGNCIAEIDCEGECGGSAEIDECGICNGTGADEGFNCNGTPLEFVYNQSSLQAFYYIDEANDMNGNPLTAEDWVGIFNGESCVGSRQWDSSLCNSGVCDVPAMGDDGYDYSEGYLLPGDYPSFKIYDYSEGEYFDAYPSENFPFENAAIYNVNELVLDFSYSIPLHQYNNLMSFYVLPEDNSVGNVMLDIQENVIAISGEATSAQYFFEEDYWTGTLMNLDISSGFWLRVAEDDTLNGSGHNFDPNRIYNLNSGANLVSFPSTGSVGISAGLPDEIEDHVLAVLGEGMSTVNSGEGWEGSLLEFKALHGYWIITDEEISFSYDLDSLEPLSRKVNPYLAAEVPFGFDYIQSTQQAFYYVEDIDLINGEIENGDWLFSYCGNTVTGARQWLGRTVDIPVMGAEGDIMTAGYCGTNDTPHFKLLKSVSQELIPLQAETPTWQPNGIFFLGSLQETAPIPNKFEFHAAYPNPFNPMTQLRFEVPTEGNLEISIFDLRGQKVETLVNDFIQPGEYTTNWDANNVASGVYFVHFTASREGKTHISQIQKLMLVK